MPEFRQLIDRFDEATAHNMFPHTVGDDFAEAWVFLAGHPLGVEVDGGAFAIFNIGMRDFPKENFRFDHLMWQGVIVLVVAGHT